MRLTGGSFFIYIFLFGSLFILVLDMIFYGEKIIGFFYLYKTPKSTWVSTY